MSVDERIMVGNANETAGERLMAEMLRSRAQLVETARRVVRCPFRAEDVVQDIALKVCQAEIGADVIDARGYLKRMVRNVAIDMVRKTGRECRLAAPEAAAEEVAAPCACPERRLEACQALRIAMAALDAAPRRTRDAFLDHRVDGVPQKDIAKREGVSPTLVNFMIRDATALCREAVAGLDEAA